MRVLLLLFLACLAITAESRPLVLDGNGKIRQFPEGSELRLAPRQGLLADIGAAAAYNKCIYVATDTEQTFWSNGTEWKVISTRGIGFNVETYGANGSDANDDTSAIVATIAAASASGPSVVFFPTGTYIVSSLFTVPANVKLLGEDANSTILQATDAGGSFDLVGDNCTVEQLSFSSTNVFRFQIRTLNVNYPTITRCKFIRANLILSNDTAGDFFGGIVSENTFTGDYTPWTSALDILTVRGVSRTRITNNRFVDVVSPGRFCKLQASIFYTASQVVSGYTDGMIFTGNFLQGTSTGARQVIDFFDGTARAVIAHNVFHIASSGSGFPCFIEQKVGGSALGFAEQAEFLVADNVFVGNPTTYGVHVSGAYGLPFDGPDQIQTGTIERNQFSMDAVPSGVTACIDVRGMHRVRICDNVMTRKLATVPAADRAINVGSCKSILISGNMIKEGSMQIGGATGTSGGEVSVGETKDLTIVNNTIEHFIDPLGGIVVTNLLGTDGTAVVTGNTIKTDIGLGTLSLIYFTNTEMQAIIVCQNAGDCGDPARNRLVATGTTANTPIINEFFNSWTSKEVVTYDNALRRVTIGDNTGKVDIYHEMATGTTLSNFNRFNNVTRSVQSVTHNLWKVESYDTSGVKTDDALAIVLGTTGGYVVAARPFKCNGLHTNVVNQTGNNTPSDNQTVVLQDCSAGNRVISITSNGISDRDGKHVYIRRVDNSGNTLTVTAINGDTILDGTTSVASVAVAAGATVHFVFDFVNRRWVKM